MFVTFVKIKTKTELKCVQERSSTGLTLPYTTSYCILKYKIIQIYVTCDNSI